MTQSRLGSGQGTYLRENNHTGLENHFRLRSKIFGLPKDEIRKRSLLYLSYQMAYSMRDRPYNAH